MKGCDEIFQLPTYIGMGFFKNFYKIKTIVVLDVRVLDLNLLIKSW